MKIIIVALLVLFLINSIKSENRCFPKVFEVEQKSYNFNINSSLQESFTKTIFDFNSKKLSVVTLLKEDQKKDINMLFLLRYDLRYLYIYNIDTKDCTSFPDYDEVTEKKKLFKI
jgi:hypothetical protein